MDSTWNVILNQCLDPVIQTHLSKTAAKLKTRKSQQRNLEACSFFMGAKAKALRTSSLLLNTAACPVGSRSSHTNLIDCQLNRTMQLISGCLHPTETQWLPMPANIHPQNLQQQSAVNKMLSTLDSHQDWLVHAGFQSPISVTAFTTSYMVRCVTCRQEHTVERRLAISFSNQLCDSSEPHLTAARLWPTSLFMVNVELFPHRPGHMQSFNVQVGLTKSPNWSRVDSQNPGPYWGLLSIDQVWRWSDNSAWIWTWWNQQVKFYGNYSTCRTKSQQQLTLTVKTKKKTAK